MPMIRFITLTLALLIAVTSQQMAMARGVMVDTFGQVVLCTGQGVITVTLDADGNIVEDTGEIAHFCPDCALTLADMPAAPQMGEATFVHIQTLRQAAVLIPQTVIVPSEVHARGPPEAA